VYKRRARILFLTCGDPARAERACVFASDRGRDWLEARGAALLDTADMAWADLVIALDEECVVNLRRGAARPWKHWALPTEAGAADAELLRRIDGLLGGMRLLARSDGSEAPSAG
jgi:hypothetical protein